jgi:hypothetical protein
MDHSFHWENLLAFLLDSSDTEGRNMKKPSKADGEAVRPEWKGDSSSR